MDLSSVALMVCLGALLSASAGLRAFMAPFGLACAQGLGWIHLSPEMAWLGHPIAIGTLAIAIILEILSDKIPAVHHALDLVHLAVKPVAGALAGASVMQDASPILAWTAAILAGGTVAGATHLTKAGLRVGSTVASVGTAAPVHSLAEDALALVVTALAMGGMALAH